MPYCPTCGNEVPAEAVFCGSCGTRLQTQGENMQNPHEANLDQQTTTTEPSTPGYAIPAPTAPGQEVPAVNTTRQSKKWYAITASVLVALFAGVGIYLAFFAPYALTEKNFPDAAVREALAAQLDSDGDGKITRDQAKEVASLNLSQSGVTSIDGLKLLPNLRELDLSGCKNLEYIDTSQVPALEILNVGDSALQEIDLSCLPKLQSLTAKGADIQKADVSKCTNLSTLSIEGEVEITGLDATNLREEWLLAGYTLEGQPGIPDSMGNGGWLPSKLDVAYSYDDQARLTKQVSVTTFGDAALGDESSNTTTYTYSYDDEAKMATREYNGGSYRETVDAYYNDIGQRVSRATYTDSGSSETTTTYQYDSAGHITHAERILNDGNKNEMDFAYNDSGQLINASTMYGAVENNQLMAFSYDEAGRVTHISAYDGQANADFSYDEEGKCISSERIYAYDNDVTDEWLFTYFYDNAGVLVSAKRINPRDPSGGFFETMGESFFDSNGNVARRQITQTYTSEDGEISEWDGNYYYTYNRAFVVKDAPEIKAPSMAYTPIGVQGEQDVLDPYTFLEDQSPIVQSFARSNGLSLLIF